MQTGHPKFDGDIGFILEPSEDGETGERDAQSGKVNLLGAERRRREAEVQQSIENEFMYVCMYICLYVGFANIW